MGKTPSTIPRESLEAYDRLVTTRPEIERKGASMPYTSVNGHMFSFLTPEGVLALRLPTLEREAFLKAYETKLCEQHGKVLEEYVEVPGPLLQNLTELRPFFDISYRYVASLKPRPTKKSSARG